jgi:hypothetical protein
MAQTYTGPVRLVRVFTDDLEYQIWVAATSREQAISRMLDCVPEGWTATLVDSSLEANEVAALELNPCEVRKIKE